jgi:hypothetical protein
MRRARAATPSLSATLLAIMVFGINFAISRSVLRALFVGVVTWLCVVFAQRYVNRDVHPEKVD